MDGAFRENIRRNVAGLLATFASFESQQDYQRTVPFVNVPTELFCQWADDLYHPDAEPFRAAFGPAELVALARFDEVFRRASAEFGQWMPPLSGFQNSEAALELVTAASLALQHLELPAG